MRRSLLIVAISVLSAVHARPVARAGDAAPAGHLEPLDPAGIRGTLVLCGGGKLPDAVRDRFVELAGGTKARLVVIPTASDDDETVWQDGEAVAEIWKSRGIESVNVLHTRDRQKADDPEFVQPLKDSTAVWISGGRQSYIAAAYSGTRVEHELHALLERGGVIGGTSAGAACQSRVMIVRGKIHDTPGLGLIPGAIVDQHFLARHRRERLLEALGAHPALVGFGIDEGTALVVKGRQLQCVGDSCVTVCLATTERCECREIVLQSGQLSDLTMLRRAARDRLQPVFPPDRLPASVVPFGSLVIVGGGGMPLPVVKRFIELAGGPESLIVVLPTANPEPLPENPRDGEFLVRAGAKNVRTLKATRRSDVESSEFLGVLKEAKGIWFGGGRQWRFVDAYEETKAVEAFRDVLRRGGVIGGSSAGATIQGEYLVRGSPLGNEEMMAAGYERGFGFLPGAAIDQHFAQRGRFADMTKVMVAHPQLLGIGIDEATALIVQGQAAEVMGASQVHFYDWRTLPPTGNAPDHVSLSAGQRYDLLARRTIDGERGASGP